MPPTPEEKRNAVDLALESKTFSRAHSLRAFLRYICESELTGRGSDLTEYRIGVEALGRPKNYSTGEDSTVRSQAYALRRKLDDLYRDERPEAVVRIHLEKGSYRPQFIGIRTAVVAAAVNPVNRIHLIPIGFRRLGFGGGLLAGVLLSVIVAVSLLTAWNGRSNRIPRNMKNAWGPVVGRNASVLLCVGTPVNLWVRDVGETPPPFPQGLWQMPSWPGISRYYERVSESGPVRKLYLQPHRNAVPFSEVAAATVVARTLAQAGVVFEIMQESTVPMSAMRNKDVVLFGKPESSPATRALLNLGVMNIALSDRTHEYIVAEHLANRAQAIAATPKRGETRSKREDYGIITVFRRKIAGSERRIIVFSGIGLGSWGAAEFFCSQSGLQRLEKSFSTEGLAHWPKSYQVLVRVDSNALRPLTSEYVTHRVLEDVEPSWPGEDPAEISDLPASGHSERRAAGALPVIDH